jgi:cyclohexanone monooxygenase
MIQDGWTLSKWQNGATTMHGMHVNGFPNFMLSSTQQGSWDNDFPFSQEIVATHLALIFREALDHDIAQLEVTAEAEDDWVRFHEDKSQRMLEVWRDCTPRYFNNEGAHGQAVLRNGNFGGSPLEFRDILRAWRESGAMPGMHQTSKSRSSVAGGSLP